MPPTAVQDRSTVTVDQLRSSLCLTDGGWDDDIATALDIAKQQADEFTGNPFQSATPVTDPAVCACGVGYPSIAYNWHPGSSYCHCDGKTYRYMVRCPTGRCRVPCWVEVTLTDEPIPSTVEQGVVQYALAEVRRQSYWRNISKSAVSGELSDSQAMGMVPTSVKTGDLSVSYGAASGGGKSPRIVDDDELNAIMHRYWTRYRLVPGF